MKSLVSVLKSNPKLASALAGLGVGGIAGASMRPKKQEKGPDPTIMTALMPGSKDHLDELLAKEGYPFTGADLRSIAKKRGM